MLQQILQTTTPKEAASVSESAKNQDKTTKSLFAKLMAILNMNTKAQQTAPTTSGNKQQGLVMAGVHTNKEAKRTFNGLNFHKITDSNAEIKAASTDGEKETKGEDITLLPVAIPSTEFSETRVTSGSGKTMINQPEDNSDVSNNPLTKTAKIKVQAEQNLSEIKSDMIKHEGQIDVRKEIAQSPGINRDTEISSKLNAMQAIPKAEVKISGETQATTLTRPTTNQAKVTRSGATAPSSTMIMPEPEAPEKPLIQTATEAKSTTGQKQIITSAKYQTDEASFIRSASPDQLSPTAPQSIIKTPKIISGAYQVMASAENLNVGKTTRSKYTPSHKLHIPSAELKRAAVLQQIAPTPVFGEGEVLAGNSGLNSGGRLADPGNSLNFNISGLEPTSTAVAQNKGGASISGPSSGPWSVAVAMQEIGHAAAQGRFRLKLALEPAHLGKVQVFLESDVNKQLQVHLILEQASSRQALEQQLPSLRQALANHGLSMGNFSMSSQQDNSQHQFFQEYNTPATNPASVLIQSTAGTEQKSGASNGHISIHI
ncbi:MAG: flagellar hook-length control protein FliK [Mariprofundaceae bacterium]